MDPIDATQVGKLDRLQEARARRDARGDASPQALGRRDDEPGAERSTSVADPRAVTPAVRSEASPQARARAPSGEGDRELVSISEEARQLLRRARESERKDEDALRAESTDPPGAASPFSSQLIAVRVGPIPIDDLPRPAAESRAAEQLSERAFLRQLERVLSLPERAPIGDEEEAELGANLRLLGEGDDDSEGRPEATGPPGARERPGFARNELEAARSALDGVERSASSARLIGSEPARAARREQEELERELAPSLRDADLVRATSLAPQSGAARAPRVESERGAENAGPVDSKGAPALEAAPQLSQVAVLEADASTAIVTRFLSNLDQPDPGPTPRPRQFLGERL